VNLADIIAPDRVGLADVQSKKRALEALAEILARGALELTAGEILNGLTAREKLGSTGIGDGVALPHARLCGVDTCIGGFLRLSQPVAFEPDGEAPVDLLFGLIVPAADTQAHLDLLRQLAELLGENQAQADLRDAADTIDLHRILLAYDAAEPDADVRSSQSHRA
jgi:PTS system nitrogen regulatory IIA component